MFKKCPVFEAVDCCLGSTNLRFFIINHKLYAKCLTIMITNGYTVPWFMTDISKTVLIVVATE